jgi:CRISPR system Cascade subunit CasB
MPDMTIQKASPSTLRASPPPELTGERFGALAKYIATAAPGVRAALARLQPEAMRPHQIAALAGALLAIGMEPDQWKPDTWPRWALIAHGMALAGHDGKQRLGTQLARAGVAEPRVTKLLTARGSAFAQNLPRVLRLLASKAVQPNWRELGPLILTQNHPDPQRRAAAETTRLAIAGAYFAELARDSHR